MAVSHHNLDDLCDDLSNDMEVINDSRSDSGKAVQSLNKNMRRRTKDCDFKYKCEWISCSHVSSSMNEFNHHVSLHRRGYTQCLGTDEEAGSGEYMFFCQWQDCNAQIEGQIDDFSRHVFYHTFHQYLKFLGQHILTVEKLESCHLDTASRNVIPELPEKLMCRWLDCGMTYDNPYIFYSHVTHHCEDYPKGNDPKVLIKCKWEGCSTTTKFWYKMKEHVRSHTQAKIVACPTCGSLFASNTRLIDHVKRQSQETDLNFECSHCNNRYGSERILRDHMRHHVNHYKCPLCDMTCHSPSAVRDHVRYRHSQERSFKCPQCDFSAKTVADLRQHTPCHLKKDVLTCSKAGCSEVFKTKKEIMEHYSNDHNLPKEYQCHICSKQFARGWTLTNHLMSVHNYWWPSGHKRFRYKLHEDGVRRLQTIRYESIEVSQQVLDRQLSPRQPSLHEEDSNSKSTGEEGEDVSSTSAEEGQVIDVTGEHWRIEPSNATYEDLENVPLETGTTGSDVDKNRITGSDCEDPSKHLHVDKNKKNEPLPQVHQPRRAGKRQGKTSKAVTDSSGLSGDSKGKAVTDSSGLSGAPKSQAGTDNSGLSGASKGQAGVRPQSAARKRRNGDKWEPEVSKVNAQAKRPGRAKVV